MCKCFFGGNVCEGYREEVGISKESVRLGCMFDICERGGGRKNDWVGLV